MGSYSPQQIQNIISNGLAKDTNSAIAYLDNHGGGSTGPPDPGTLPVYWGGMDLPDAKKAYAQYVLKDPDAGGRAIVPAKPNAGVMSVNDGVAWLEEQFYQQSPAWQQIYTMAVNTGRYGANPSPVDVENMWKEALGWSASLLNANPDNTLSPIDYLTRLIGPGAGKARDSVVHSKQTTVTSALDAKGLVNAESQTGIGRDATLAEQAKITAALNAAEKANPSLNTQTTHYDANGVVTAQQGLTTGGLGQAGTAQLLHDQVAQNPDYRQYQAATTYFGALLQTLGALNQAGA